MGIKNDPKAPGTWMVFHSKRHPVTRQSVGLRRRGFKTMAEARRAYAQIVIDVEDKVRRKVLPVWSELLINA